MTATQSQSDQASQQANPSNASAQLDEAVLFRRLSPSSRRALEVANGLSYALNQDRVHMEHLIVGLHNKQDGPAQHLFAGAKIGPDQLAAVIAEAVETPLPTTYNVSELDVLPNVSDHVRQALIAAQAAADARQSDRVQSRHLLYGALSVEDCGVIKALHNHGVAKEDIDLGPLPNDEVAKVPLPSGEVAEPPWPRIAIAGFQPDRAEGKDLLGIEREVNALCSIIAAGDVQPPLSIGLFGDWGSGKSFFMKKMRERIELLKVVARDAKGETAYCSNIVQLEFNAWHFIDTNLWASLTSEIFERLDEALAIGQKLDAEKERQRLTVDTASSRYVLAEELRKKELAEAELQRNEQRLKQLQDAAAFAANMGALDVLRNGYQLALQKTEVSDKLDSAMTQLNLDQATQATNKTKEQLIELHGLTGRVMTLWLSIQNPKNRAIWLVALLGLVVVPIGVDWLLEFALASQIDDAISETVGWVFGILAGLSPFIGPASRAITAIEEARAESQAVIEQERQARVTELEQQRSVIQQQVADAQQAVNTTTARVKTLEDQLDSLRADRQMSNFIKQRHQSTDYTAHLGVIARARNDFEQLSTLLEQVRQQEATEQTVLDNPAQPDENGAAAHLPRIDRIVLYIDDLDRCPEDKVVDVLQAVHLLLAFPLFVVVVGVDSRWLLHSLQQHTKVFQAADASPSTQAEQAEELGMQERMHWQSTPLNYLEKIFQIPFALRPMEPGGFGELIDSLTTLQSRPPRHTAPKPLATPDVAGSSDSIVPPDPKHNRDDAQPQEQIIAANPPANATNETPAESTTAEHPVQPVIDPNPDYLALNDWERDYIKQLYSLIPSPRAAKRFVNVYRLLRASLDQHQVAAFIGDAHQGQYQAVLLLLAMLIGYPAEATDILRGLLEQPDEQPWWSFIDTFAPPATVVANGNGAATANGNGAAARAINKRAEGRWRELRAKLDQLRWLIADARSCEDFKLWTFEISRYSFQSGRVMLLPHEQGRPALRD